MFAGPVFTREVVTAPRRARLYAARAAYVAALLVLLSTAWQVLTGTQVVRNIGEIARFGATSFQILAPLQLAVAVFFSALSAAGAIAAEKDRRTLDLLLLSRMSNVELVLGKLLASLLMVLVLILAAAPMFMLAALLGGVSFAQIGRALAVTVASAVAAGSIGAIIAFWREKTFQTLAITLLALVFWLGLGEAIGAGALGDRWRGASCAAWAAGLSPWRATLEAARPFEGAVTPIAGLRSPVELFLLVAAGVTLVTNATAIALVRVWNPSREARGVTTDVDPRQAVDPDGAGRHWRLAPAAAGDAAPSAPARAAAVPGRTRSVWDNPILWREMRTWAYGRKMLLVRLAYLLLFAVAAAGLYSIVHGEAAATRAALAVPLVPLFVLSLVLVNVQAVTALTSERDVRALDLLLVTDLTPREFIVGKLAGALYNTKEMIVLPIALTAYLTAAGALALENAIYLAGGWLVMVAFVTTLGIHCGMNYVSSRAAIAVSVGTVFFLCVGVATCMRILVAFSGSFQFQLQPFLAFMVGGAVGLLVALGWRNPSAAIWLAAFSCPFATFYALTSFLLSYTLAVLLTVAAAYGFATAAMLIPAIHEFDVATGRTTGDEVY